MTRDEIRKEIMDMGSKITEAIHQFEKRTGLLFQGMDITRGFDNSITKIHFAFEAVSEETLRFSGDEGRETTPSFSFLDEFKEVQEQIHQNAVEKGWWDEDRNDGEIIALIHSELSEALEGLRNGNPPSKKIPEFSVVEEEYADVIIRLMDHAEARGWDLARAIKAKMIYNIGRERKHGKAF